MNISLAIWVDCQRSLLIAIKGALTVNGQRLSGGDAAMIANESRIEISQGEEAEVLVFDLA